MTTISALARVSGSMRSILPRSCIRVLRPVLGVVGGAAVAEAEPELAVGAERDVAAVVVGVGLVGGETIARLDASIASPSVA